MVTDLDANKTELFASSTFGTAWSPDSRTLAYGLCVPTCRFPELALAVRRSTVQNGLYAAGPKTRFWCRQAGRGMADPSSARILSPLYRTCEARVSPLSPSPAQAERLLIDEPRSWLWQASFSPNGRWLAFVANSLEDVTRAGIYVAREGAAPAEWIHIAATHPWADKPRWASNGRLLYFVSNPGSPYFNLWAVRFDPDREPRSATRCSHGSILQA